MGEGALRQTAPGHKIGRSTQALHVGEDRRVVFGIGYDGDEVVVLGRRPNKGGTADIDVLDAVRPGRAARHGLAEGIEVDHHEIDGLQTVLPHGGEVALFVPPRQDAAVDAGMQRLDPPVHDLREAGDLGDLGDRQLGLSHRPRGAAG